MPKITRRQQLVILKQFHQHMQLHETINAATETILTLALHNSAKPAIAEAFIAMAGFSDLLHQFNCLTDDLMCQNGVVVTPWSITDQAPMHQHVWPSISDRYGPFIQSMYGYELDSLHRLLYPMGALDTPRRLDHDMMVTCGCLDNAL